MSIDLENHMLIGRATPVEEDSGTFDEYFRLRDPTQGDYRKNCVWWLIDQVPSELDTLDKVVNWTLLDGNDGWKFTENEDELRAAVANAILHAGDMHRHGLDPCDNGEGGQASAVCDAILRNKRRKW